MAGKTSEERAWDRFVRELGDAGQRLLFARLHAESLCRSDDDRRRVRRAFEERHRELFGLREVVREIQDRPVRELLS